jgi:hypothetical protein
MLSMCKVYSASSRVGLFEIESPVRPCESGNPVFSSPVCVPLPRKRAEIASTPAKYALAAARGHRDHQLFFIGHGRAIVMMMVVMVVFGALVGKGRVDRE